ncbi:MAG: hypothetical protein A3F84_26155 [Candidatus Handelsmanbacteria bacterium RIFCSPLOWO2_12_FULL_64_10]|uniref:TonB-dependent receptor plug domain-containing protein n=1 Tax=Handelsmanbacteria sp. (strain RIFCSPLOWO2_12_FULL_64_10) TaxID=1817868 RepID=A0A1F6CAF1_HANXR|nr:MAG: hypothetical protein A3F84_26155 [Candidatus Handelsmanbacteria bacterium RIFCSPLOWO2_12_FULL_64_10]
MKLGKFFALSMAILAVLAMAPSLAHAGSSGKLTGVVRDVSGHGLPGASVVLEGTRRGAVTDAEGRFVILSVNPGVYSLSASLIGYTKVIKSRVEVNIDYTTTVDFQLKEEAVAASEVVVTAERPPVEPDRTSTQYTVTAHDIEKMTLVRSTGEFVSLQPGVSQDGLNIVRGGDAAPPSNASIYWYYRPNDVAFVVDGVQMISNDGNVNTMFTGVNKSAVQELSVITGVPPAEYGNIQSGIINVVTKDGGQRYHGWMEYRNIPAGKKHWGANVYDAPIHLNRMKWNDPAWASETDPATGRVIHQRTDYTGVIGHVFEGSLSGPLAKNITFLFSGKHSRVANPFPGTEKIGFYSEGGKFIPAPGNFQGSGAITWNLSSNVKVKTGIVWQGYTSYYDGLTSASQRGMGDNGRNLFLPEEYASSGKYRFREKMGYVVLTHTVAPKTFYEIRFSASRSLQDSINAPTETGAVRKDKDNWFNLGTRAANWEVFDRLRFTFKSDLSSQVSQGHFIKTGFDITFYKTWWTRREDLSALGTNVLFLGADRDMGKPVRPIQGAFYAQDKMEFQGMVVNLGLRLDYFSPRVKWPVDTGLYSTAYSQYYTTRKLTPLEKVDTHWVLSPRLGISHPITSRSAMRFSSGLFLQWPDFFALYGSTYGSRNQAASQDLNKDGKIGPEEVWNNMIASGYGNNQWGDPRIKPEKSLIFEAGGDWNFVSDYTVGLTAYYRAESDQLGEPTHAFQDPRGAGAPRVKTNLRGEDSRGLELSIRKNLSHSFSFQVAYNVEWSAIAFTMGVANSRRFINPDSLYIASGSWTWDWTIDPATGARTPKALTAAEIAQYGKIANDRIRSNKLQYDLWSKGGTGAGRPWDLAGKIEGTEGSKGLYFFSDSDGTRGFNIWETVKPKDRRHSGKVQIVITTPVEIQTKPRLVGWLMSDVNVNVIYRLQSGITFGYVPPTSGLRQFRSGPIDSRFDLEFQKTFNSKGQARPSFFVSVYNLFNQKNINRFENASDWVQWGVETVRPNNPDLLTYGDINDNQRYTSTPRKVELGLRLSF